MKPGKYTVFYAAEYYESGQVVKVNSGLIDVELYTDDKVHFWEHVIQAVTQQGYGLILRSLSVIDYEQHES